MADPRQTGRLVLVAQYHGIRAVLLWREQSRSARSGLCGRYNDHPAAPGRSPAIWSIVPIPGGVKQVSQGSLFTIVIGADNKVYGWGQNDAGQLVDGTTNDRYNYTVAVEVCPFRDCGGLATAMDRMFRCHCCVLCVRQWTTPGVPEPSGGVVDISSAGHFVYVLGGVSVWRNSLLLLPVWMFNGTVRSVSFVCRQRASVTHGVSTRLA